MLPLRGHPSACLYFIRWRKALLLRGPASGRESYCSSIVSAWSRITWRTCQPNGSSRSRSARTSSAMSQPFQTVRRTVRSTSWVVGVGVLVCVVMPTTLQPIMLNGYFVRVTHAGLKQSFLLLSHFLDETKVVAITVMLLLNRKHCLALRLYPTSRQPHGGPALRVYCVSTNLTGIKWRYAYQSSSTFSIISSETSS